MMHYYMPAEWQTHTGTLLAWPHDPKFWGRLHTAVQQVIANIAAEISEVERVCIFVPTANWVQQVRHHVQKAGAVASNVTVRCIPTEEVWIRDFGPTMLLRRASAPSTLPPRVLVDWVFNSWGRDKGCKQGDAFPQQFAKAAHLPRINPDFVAEGGALEPNGQGDLLVTRSVMLDPKRNPGVTQASVERTLAKYLGVQRIHWFHQGLTGDDTNGHVDDFARFVSQDRLVMVRPQDGHPDAETMRENISLAKGFRNAAGAPFEIVKLPCPSPVVYRGQTLPASYANFYICNGKVLMPTFGRPTDAHALEVLQSCFPLHRVVGIESRPLLTQRGGIHCATQPMYGGPP